MVRLFRVGKTMKRELNGGREFFIVRSMQIADQHGIHCIAFQEMYFTDNEKEQDIINAILNFFPEWHMEYDENAALLTMAKKSTYDLTQYEGFEHYHELLKMKASSLFACGSDQRLMLQRIKDQQSVLLLNVNLLRGFSYRQSVKQHVEAPKKKIRQAIILGSFDARVGRMIINDEKPPRDGKGLQHDCYHIDGQDNAVNAVRKILPTLVDPETAKTTMLRDLKTKYIIPPQTQAIKKVAPKQVSQLTYGAGLALGAHSVPIRPLILF
jgi:hypothetical protein